MVDEVNCQNIKEIRKIGSGGHADVSLAIWTMRDGSTIEIAVKTFRNTSNEKYNEREIEFLKKVRHRNIVSLYALTTNSEGITSLLLEYSKCGSLKNYLYAKDKNDSYLYSYDISDSLRWMHQLAQAIQYLHQNIIVHRDLKPDNLLLFDNFKTLKVTDFGTVKESITKSTAPIGTPGYEAPEIINGSNKKCTLANDVYSYSIVFWEVLERKTPYSHLADRNHLAKRYNSAKVGDRPHFELTENKYRPLIETGWHQKPTERPTMEIILSCFTTNSEEAIDLDLSPLRAFQDSKPTTRSRTKPQSNAEKERKIRYAEYAPRECKWYHGILEDNEANRLCQEPGSYLVYRIGSSYFLRYFGIDHGIRINVEFGDYSLANDEDKFCSLNDLVGYYTKYGYIKDNQRLEKPVSPPQPVLDKHRVKAIINFSDTNYKDELKFEAGDIFTVHNKIENDWLWVTAVRSGEDGMIFKAFVEDVDGSIDVNIMYSWFHLNCTKEQAVTLLHKDGDFLVRSIGDSPDDYMLCVKTRKDIQEYKIKNLDVLYMIEDHYFDSLQKVIDFMGMSKPDGGLQNTVDRDHRVTENVTISAYHTALDYFDSLQKVIDFMGMSKPDGGLQNTVDRDHRVTENVTISAYHTALDERKEKLLSKEMHCGELELKSRQKDSWKKVYVKLMDTTMGYGLFIYETSKHLKPVDSIEISKASLYKCHETLWNCKFCFQIYDFQGQTRFFRSSERNYPSWIRTLQVVCVYQLRECFDGWSIRQSLKINVKSGKSLPAGSNFCNILLDNLHKVARTDVGQGPGPDFKWDQTFELKDILLDISSVTFKMNIGGERTFLLKDNLEMETVAWYKLLGDNSQLDYGSLELSIQRRTTTYLDAKDLNQLNRLLAKLNVLQVNDFLESCPIESDALINTLGEIFRYNGHMINLIVERYESGTVPSLKTMGLMDSYLVIECGDYLKQTLGEVVEAILSGNFDINFDSLINSIFKNVAACPFVVRKICSRLVGKDVEKDTSMIVEFMFEGLFCRALKYPYNFGLLDNEHFEECHRNLDIVANRLQELAHLRKEDKFFDQFSKNPRRRSTNIMVDQNNTCASKLEYLCSLCIMNLMYLKKNKTQDWTKLIKLIEKLI